MKNKIILLMLFVGILYIPIKAQTFTNYYKDSTLTTKELATYYKKATYVNDSLWAVTTVYLKRGIKDYGFYKDKKLTIRQGIFTINFPNKEKDSGLYIDNKREGLWRYYFTNGQVSSEEIYNNDTVVSFKHWDENGILVKGKLSFIVRPSLGDRVLVNFLMENLEYPESAIDLGITKKVFVKYVVKRNGEIDDIKVLKKDNYGFDKEALRVINLLAKKHKYSPGKVHNRPIKYWYTFPLIFMPDEDETEF